MRNLREYALLSTYIEWRTIYFKTLQYSSDSVRQTIAAKTPAQAPKTNPSMLTGVAALDFEVVEVAAELAEALAVPAPVDVAAEAGLDAADEVAALLANKDDENEEGWWKGTGRTETFRKMTIAR